MSGDIMIGTCGVCGKKEVSLTRTYFHYGVPCTCHSPDHFYIVDHCHDCEPKEPPYMKIEFELEDFKTRIVPLLKTGKREKLPNRVAEIPLGRAQRWVSRYLSARREWVGAESVSEVRTLFSKEHPYMSETVVSYFLEGDFQKAIDAELFEESMYKQFDPRDLDRRYQIQEEWDQAEEIPLDQAVKRLILGLKEDQERGSFYWGWRDNISVVLQNRGINKFDADADAESILDYILKAGGQDHEIEQIW